MRQAGQRVQAEELMRRGGGLGGEAGSANSDWPSSGGGGGGGGDGFGGLGPDLAQQSLAR